MCESRPSLDAARQRVGRIARPSGAAAHGHVATGHTALDAALGGGFAKGRLHELFASTPDDATAAAGFAALLALRAGDAPILWLRTDRAARRAGRLEARGVAELGGDPARLVLALAPDAAALLRCANDAARCPGTAALVIECWGKAPEFDLTASRRLTLSAERSGVTILIVRVDVDPAPTTAETRWSVACAPSVPLAADAPGHSMFALELLRRRGGAFGSRWMLEWDGDSRAFRDPAAPGLVVPVPAGGPAEDRARRSNA